MAANAKPKARKVSITIDGVALDEFKRITGNERNLSATLSDALKKHLKRLQLIALLEQWEAEDPSTPQDVASGERLWQEMQSFWIPERLLRSRKGTRRSGTRSRKT